MKMRSDSAFAKLTEDQCDMLVLVSQDLTLEQVLEVLKKEGIVCTLGTLSRFLKKAKEDELLRDAEASDGSIEAFAKRGANPKVREAALAAMREPFPQKSGHRFVGLRKTSHGRK